MAYRACATTASFLIPTTEDGVVDLDSLQTDPEVAMALHVVPPVKVARAKKVIKRARKEATKTDKQGYAKQFLEAKRAEYESWKEHEVFDLVDLRKTSPKNFVTGRWVLTIERDKDGTFQKCKARWVLRGFQDRQKDFQQTDSPTATRPGFRLACQLAANRQWDIGQIDLKTASFFAGRVL